MPTPVKCLVLLVFCSFLVVRADIRGCHCEVANAADMAQRVCGLCAEAERQPPYMTIFFLKDANPTKPNRILALPRIHTPGDHLLASLPPEVRLELWSAAIARAQELWGNDWALACNSPEKRTQCHAHVHIGKLLPNQENADFVIANGPADIPLPGENGILVHPAGAKLHCHLEAAPELSLMR